TGAPRLARGARVVGVVAELRRQVERDREPGLPALEQVAEALVRLLGRGEARVLANRPRPAAIHVSVGPARERELARLLELGGSVARVVDRLDLDARVDLGALERGADAATTPVAPGGSQRVEALPAGRVQGRVADDFLAHERDEAQLGPLGRLVDLLGAPLVEGLDSGRSGDVLVGLDGN